MDESTPPDVVAEKIEAAKARGETPLRLFSIRDKKLSAKASKARYRKVLARRKMQKASRKANR